MTSPLLSLSHKLVWNPNTQATWKTGFFGTLADWDLNAKDSCIKTQCVFFAKKLFSMLDAVGIGKCFYSAGLNAQVEQCEYYQLLPDYNRGAREKMVSALGGEAACNRIPIVQLNRSDLTHYLKLGDAYFRGGQWVVQGEDEVGRKFVALRLANRTGQIVIATLHQRFLETQDRGDLWTLNFRDDVDPNTDRAAEFIEKVRTNRHNQFSMAPKP